MRVLVRQYLPHPLTLWVHCRQMVVRLWSGHPVVEITSLEVVLMLRGHLVEVDFGLPTIGCINLKTCECILGSSSNNTSAIKNMANSAAILAR